MDPLIQLCKDADFTMSSVINVRYFRDSRGSYGVSYSPGDIVEVEKAIHKNSIHSEIPKDVDSYLRDIVGGIVLGPYIEIENRYGIGQKFCELPKPFGNRAGNKLLNCLRICPQLLNNDPLLFAESMTISESMRFPINRMLNCFDTAAAPGSWCNAMLMKTEGKVVGVSLPESMGGLKWYDSLLAHERFIRLDYDIINKQDEIISVLRGIPEINLCVCDGRPVDNCSCDKSDVGLCICDAGTSYEMIVGETDEKYQAALHKHIVLSQKAKLIISQFSLCLKSLKENGNAFVKLFNVNYQQINDATQIFASCFSRTALVKLATSRGKSNEVYLICLYRKKDVIRSIEILDYVRMSDTPQQYTMLSQRNEDWDNYVNSVRYAELEIFNRSAEIMTDIYNRCTDLVREQRLITKEVINRVLSQMDPSEYNVNLGIDIMRFCTLLGIPSTPSNITSQRFLLKDRTQPQTENTNRGNRWVARGRGGRRGRGGK